MLECQEIKDYASPKGHNNQTLPEETEGAREGCCAAVYQVNRGCMTLDGIDAAGCTVTAGGITDGRVKSTAGASTAIIRIA